MNCVIYTYGGHQRGMGHIYQSRALADELVQAGARVQFIVPNIPAGVHKLREWGMDVLEIPYESTDEKKISQIERQMAGEGIDVAIVDILESATPLMCYMANKADLLVSLDDIGDGRVWADLLINIIHHPSRPAGAHYREINDLNHVVLRPEFHKAHQRDKVIPDTVRKLLVSQGGSDTFGGLIQLAEALEMLPEQVEVHLLVGPAFLHDDPLAAIIARVGRRFVLQRDVRDMAGLMQQMDLAITGGGKTLFELASVGVPFIVSTEEPRELETAAIVARDVLCENLGLRREVGAARIAQTVRRLVADREQRLAMSRSGKEAVDGRGAMRSVRQIAKAWRKKRELAGGLAL